MSKKTKIILVVLLFLIILSLGIVFFVLQNKNSSSGNGLSIRDFLPFGEAPTNQEIPTMTSTAVKPDALTEVGTAKLRRIYEKPMAGAFAFKEGDDIKVRFVDKATGHIFENNLKEVLNKRLTNTTLPKIQEAIWAGKNSVILRYLKEDEETIETIALKLIPPEEKVKPFEFKNDLKEGDVNKDVFELQRALNRDIETSVSVSGPGSIGNETNRFGPKTTDAVKKFQQKYSGDILTPQNIEVPNGVVDSLTRSKLNEVTGVNSVETSPEEENLHQTSLAFLPENIKDIAFIQSLQKAFYLEEDVLGTVGTLIDISNQKKTQIFQSGATEWSVGKNRGDIIISTKASSNSLGIAYSLSQSGVLNKIFGGYFGLTVNSSPSKEDLLYSESGRDGFVLNLYNKNKNSFVKLDSNTLPEKCVWSKISKKIYCSVPKIIPQSNYPDAWYKGEVSFEDDIWMIDTETGKETVLQNLSSTDGINLFLSPEEEYLFFTNKKDSQLWSLRLIDNETE